MSPEADTWAHGCVDERWQKYGIILSIAGGGRALVIAVLPTTYLYFYSIFILKASQLHKIKIREFVSPFCLFFKPELHYVIIFQPLPSAVTILLAASLGCSRAGQYRHVVPADSFLQRDLA